MENTELLQRMKEKAESVQAVVSHISNMDEAFQYTLELTKKQGGKTIAAPGIGEKEQADLQKICEAQEIRLFKDALREHMTGIHTALTFVDWGIAETGTLVLDSASEDIRIATMLAETHVAILPGSKICPDAMSLENELKKLQKYYSRYVAFITGASRTADIERVLTIGVHGPQELHILIMN